MNVHDLPQYMEDVRAVAGLPLPWEKLQDSSVLLSGASGMIGSFLVDVLLAKNAQGMNCHIYALGRNAAKAEERFSYCFADSNFSFLVQDVNRPLDCDLPETVDYYVHLASNTHPVAYATDPVGTITANIIGTRNMLESARTHGAKRVAFCSSNEIYGENRGDTEKFTEQYCGYIDCNTLRAGYPESKRCGEALCQAYIRQYGMDVVIPRLTRTYGPTLLRTDTKALSQFLTKGVAGEDIVLKSHGTQYYSYLYVADTVSGLLTVLLQGECGGAYNVADEASDIMLKDLAGLIAKQAGKKVIFELPDAVESAGFSKATKARLDSSKLQALGWKAGYSMEAGISRTMSMLKECCWA